MSKEKFLKEGLYGGCKVYLSFIGITEDKLPFDSDKYKFINDIYVEWIAAIDSSLLEKANTYKNLLDFLISTLEKPSV